MAKRFGVMLDMSRNAVMRPDELKSYIKRLKDLGYNMVQLYTEDTYEVEGEPYFGYMRGRYSTEELRDVVSYANGIGVEVIPCIQTLAHLNTIFNWQKYADINDCADILLIEDERTYDFIENMFRALKKCFTTNIAHIGMDEAHMLGLGRYLDKHGYKNRFEILSRHLNRVIEIGKKYGFKCIMWSDMFFRLANGGGYYDWNNITDDVVASCPKDVGLVYWDYYHNDKKFYDGMMAAHNKFDNEIWFAGGAWTWVGLAPLASFTVDSMRKAMASCREQNVENILITMWGDNGRECSSNALLPALYNIKRYYDGVTDLDTIRREFREITGEDYDAMMDLELPNMVAGNVRDNPANISKVMLYSDPLFGFLDVTVKDGVGAQFAAHRETLLAHAAKSEKFAYLFETNAALCDVMEIKYDLGKRTRDAYNKGDKAALESLLSEYAECRDRVEKLYIAFSAQWHKENKPHGFEVQDSRYGGIMARLTACARRIKAYLDGEIDTLEELDEELLPYALSHNNRHVISGTPGTEGIPSCDGHNFICSVNRVY